MASNNQNNLFYPQFNFAPLPPDSEDDSVSNSAQMSQESVEIPPGQTPATVNLTPDRPDRSKVYTILDEIKAAKLDESDLNYLINAIRGEIFALSNTDSDSSTRYDSGESRTSKRKTKRKSAEAAHSQTSQKSTGRKRSKPIIPETAFPKPAADTSELNNTAILNPEFDNNNTIKDTNPDNIKYIGVSRQGAIDAQKREFDKYSNQHKPVNPNTIAAAIPKSNPPSTIVYKNKPPDIVVRGNQKWNELRKSLADKGVQYKTISNTSAGLKIRTPNIEQYNTTLKLLASTSRQYHTFLPEEERNLQVVVRGSGMEFTNQEVMEELKYLGFNPIKVNRMRHPRTRQEMPLLVISLPRDEESKAIYNVQFLCEIPITVEPLRPSTVVGQCHRCLLFGHSATRCTANYRCKNCGDGHDSMQCPIPNGPFKCANCREGHRATYRGCDRAPQSRKVTVGNNPVPSQSNKVPTVNNKTFPPLRNSNTAATNQTQNSKPKINNISSRPTTAQVVGRKNNTAVIPANQPDIAAALNQFQNALVTLSDMFTNLSRLFIHTPK